MVLSMTANLLTHSNLFCMWNCKEVVFTTER